MGNPNETGFCTKGKLRVQILVLCCFLQLVVLVSCSSASDYERCFMDASAQPDYVDRLVVPRRAALRELSTVKPNWAAYLVNKCDSTNQDLAFRIWRVIRLGGGMEPSIKGLLAVPPPRDYKTEPEPFVSAYVALMVKLLHLEPRYPPDSERSEFWAPHGKEVSRWMTITAKGDPDVYQIWIECLDFLGSHTSLTRTIFPDREEGLVTLSGVGNFSEETYLSAEYILEHRKEILETVDRWFEQRQGRFVVSSFSFGKDGNAKGSGPSWNPERRGICAVDEQTVEIVREGGK